MMIILDLENQGFVLKMLSRLYESLPPGIRSQKSLLPASELILEATEYISYLKNKSSSSYVASLVSPPSDVSESLIPSLVTGRLSSRFPLLYEALKMQKSPTELQLLSEVLLQSKGAPSASPCIPLDNPSIPKAHEMIYSIYSETEDLDGVHPLMEGLRRSCLTPSCINPQHSHPQAPDIFLRTLSRKALNQEQAKPLLLSLISKLNTKELKTLTKGFATMNSKECFPVNASSFKEMGHISEIGKQVQELLFKTFRFHEAKDNGKEKELCLLSSTECSLSSGKFKDTQLCLNPWHFDRVDKRDPNRHYEEHVCTLRLVIASSVAMFRCPLCWKELSSAQVKELGPPTKKSPPTRRRSTSPYRALKKESLEDKPKIIKAAPTSLKGPLKANPSPILRERSTRKRKIQPLFQCWKCLIQFTTNSELENHPCSSRQRSSDDEEEEQEEQDLERQDNLRMEADKILQVKIEQLDYDEVSLPMSPPKKKSRQEESLDNLLPVKEEVPDEDEFEHRLFEESLSFQAMENNIEEESSSDVVYACVYCGFSNSDLRSMSAHKNKCKVLGFEPLPEIGMSPKKTARKSTKESNTSCAYCEVTFANTQMLQVHMMKMQCRSSQCGVCRKFYANSKALQAHACEGQKLKESDGIIFFKLDGSSSGILECDACGLKVPSKHVLAQHQSSSACFCRECNSSFKSVCKFVSHPCHKDHFGT